MESFSELLETIKSLSDCNQVVIALITICIVSIIYCFQKNKSLPPGPTGIPYLGLWPTLKDLNTHLTMDNLHKTYGEIFSFRYAGALYISLGSMKVMKEMHITNADCFERITDFSLLSHFFADSVGFKNGEPWKILRKFTLQQLKELGMTAVKENSSTPMYDTIRETVEYLKSKKGEPIGIIPLLMNKCNSIIRHVMFGEDGITEQEVREINESYSHVFGFMILTNLLHVGKFAKYFIFPLKSSYRNAEKHGKIMENILFKIIQRHKTSFDNENPRDFIDVYFKEKIERHSKNDPTAEYFTDKILIGTLLQLIGDGVLAVAIFVSVFIKYVADHEEEQGKIYKELMEVVGQERQPSIEDKNRMPYTSSLILEIIRTNEVFTMFPSQQCIRETSVQGYRIPKGAITLMNTYTSHHNPNTYENPHVFNSSRFIPRDGKQKPDLPVTFGVGRRSCLGESFTMAEVFLFLTTIIQNFELTLPDSSKNNTDYDLLISGKMEICAWPRN